MYRFVPAAATQRNCSAIITMVTGSNVACVSRSINVQARRRTTREKTGRSAAGGDTASLYYPAWAWISYYPDEAPERSCRQSEFERYALYCKCVFVQFSLDCALASCGAVYCNRSCLWVCDSGRAVSEPYYSQRARSVCVSLSAFFIEIVTSTTIFSCLFVIM